MEESPLLDDYILQATGKANPSICFLGTASGDSESYALMFFRRFVKSDCRPCELRLFRREVRDIPEFLCSRNIIYVGGGNTANMLAVWREHGVDLALREAYENGVVLAGISAGSICWFEHGVTDSFGHDLQPLHCLGFLSGSNCPHYDGEPNRRPTYQRLICEGFPPGIAADDGAGLHFVEGELHAVVTSRPDARAYRVACVDETVVEQDIRSRYLGD